MKQDKLQRDGGVRLRPSGGQPLSYAARRWQTAEGNSWITTLPPTHIDPLSFPTLDPGRSTPGRGTRCRPRFRLLWVNYLLMVLCVLITVGFQGGPEIGHAFGVAVIWVMLITTALMTVVMVVIWEVRAPYAAAFFAVYLAVEGVYMSSLMNKMAQGGWVPFAITAFFLSITLSWTYGRKKSEYEAGHMITTDELAGIVARSARVPGVCFFFTDLMNGVPPIVRHYAEHTGSLRELLVFVTVRTLPVTSVLPEERFLVAAMDEVPAGVYRCVAQYGYMDTQDMEGDEFLESIVAALKDVAGADEAAMMDRARRNGVSVVIGRTILTARGRKHGWFKRFIINHMYRFLQKNFNSSVATLRMDHDKTLQVGNRYKIE